MKYLSTGLLVVCSFLVNAQDLREDLKRTYQLLRSNSDSTKIMANSLLERSIEENDLFVEVQANFILGYLTKSNEEYGVSVIYYLEAIRLAEDAEYETVLNDRISLRKNLANTFRNFKANGLATQYNLEAIKIAEEENNINQLIDLKMNQGLVYQNEKQYNLAIEMFEDVLAITPEKYRLDALNQLGLIQQKLKKFDQSKEYLNQLIDLAPDDHNLRATALHNLGEINAYHSDYVTSIDLINQAIDIYTTNGQNDNYGLFNSYRNKGLYLFNLKEYTEAEISLNKAVDLFEFAKSEPQSFEVYKTLSDLYYTLGEPDKGRVYQEKYFSVSQAYIDQQQEIQERAKEYNFELIVKRYFDDVEKQDRMSSVVMYSKISIGSLLVMLILVVAYFQSEKIRMRKSIEKELKTLKVLG